MEIIIYVIIGISFLLKANLGQTLTIPRSQINGKKIAVELTTGIIG